MELNRIKYLLHKYFENTLDADEKLDLENGIELFSNEELTGIISEINPTHITPFTMPEVDVPRRVEDVHKRLVIHTQQEQSISRVRGRPSLWRWWQFAAAACFLVAGIFLYTTYSNSKVEQQTVINDVNPAKPLATIAVGNGEEIKVDADAFGLIYEKNGLQVFKNKAGEISCKDTLEAIEQHNYLTIKTPKGGFTKLKLMDGTLVELNAASSITYPTSFHADTREVRVEGEVFFKVASNKKWPFRVISEKQTIEVLGTSFNLVSNSKYAKTTLLEGLVRILVKDKSYLLNPGEQAVVTNDVKIGVVNAVDNVSWVNQQFTFNNSSFVEILREIENWYDVTMVFADDDIVDVKLYGTVSRNVKLSELLRVIELNTNYKFKIEGRRVIVRHY